MGGCHKECTAEHRSAVITTTIRPKLIFNSNLAESRSSVSVDESFWGLIQSTAVILPCSEHNSNMIGLLAEIFRDFSVRWVSGGYPILQNTQHSSHRQSPRPTHPHHTTITTPPIPTTITIATNESDRPLRHLNNTCEIWLSNHDAHNNTILRSGTSD